MHISTHASSAHALFGLIPAKRLTVNQSRYLKMLPLAPRPVPYCMIPPNLSKSLQTRDGRSHANFCSMRTPDRTKGRLKGKVNTIMSVISATPTNVCSQFSGAALCKTLARPCLLLQVQGTVSCGSQVVFQVCYTKMFSLRHQCLPSSTFSQIASKHTKWKSSKHIRR